MSQYSLSQVRSEVGDLDVTAVAEAGNRLARTLGASEPWVRLRGDTVEVEDRFAEFVRNVTAGSRRDGPAEDTSATPGW